MGYGGKKPHTDPWRTLKPIKKEPHYDIGIVPKYYTFQFHIIKKNIFALLDPMQHAIAYSAGKNSTTTNT